MKHNVVKLKDVTPRKQKIEKSPEDLSNPSDRSRDLNKSNKAISRPIDDSEKRKQVLIEVLSSSNDNSNANDHFFPIFSALIFR